VHRTARILRERVTVHERVDKPWEEQPIPALNFNVPARSGDLALIASRITKAFGTRVLFRDVTIHVRRGERLVIAGPNGCGKTTLLNILRGQLAPEAGSVRLGANVVVGSVTQDGAELNPDATPLQICGADSRSRTMLGCLKLRPDCLNRKLRELSAGERTKVALAKILTGDANILLLDEPTNHLEIEAQEALEEALKGYPGGLVVGTHDRAFLEALGPDLSILNLHALTEQ
jgi:ATP-binding cassette subfamily F protein 3